MLRPLKLTTPTEGDWKYETEGCSVCTNDVVIADVLPGPNQDSDGLLLAGSKGLLTASEKLMEYAREVCKHVSVRKTDDQLDNILADAIILAGDAIKKAKGE